MLHLISPQVLPRPDDWKASASLTGFCFLEPRSAAGVIQPTAYSPDRDLAAFLENGPAPVYARFGRMISRDPEALADLVVEAAPMAGERLILSPGLGRVLPRTALPAVSQGAGRDSLRWLDTTAASLRYGIPSTVVVFFADQPAWGRTLEWLAVSPAPHRLKTLSAEALATSIRELRHLLSREDGVACTVTAIEMELNVGRR